MGVLKYSVRPVYRLAHRLFFGKVNLDLKRVQDSLVSYIHLLP
jgi:hypothetical protein